MCKAKINSIKYVQFNLHLDNLSKQDVEEQVEYFKTLNEVLFVEVCLFVCFVFRLAATKGIRISRREYLKVNVMRTWLEKSLFLLQNITI